MGGRRAVWQRAGERTAQPVTIDELLDRVVVCPSGCWLWAGGTSGDGSTGGGYGRILRPGTRNAMAAHRYVCEVFNGPIPPGHQVDHLCREWIPFPKLGRLCVRPEHLEAVTPAENIRRRDRDNGVASVVPIEPPASRGWSIEAELIAAFEG